MNLVPKLLSVAAVLTTLSATVSPNAEHAYDGVYRFPGGDTLVIARVDDQGALILLNLTTGAARVLGADSMARDTYAFGHTVFVPVPAVGVLRFVRSGDGLVTGVDETIDGRVIGTASRLRVEEREVHVAGEGGADLVGTLLLPPGSAVSSVAVILHGAGPETRWSSFNVALALLNRGVGAFIYDKRASGASTGSPPPSEQTEAATVLTSDAVAVVTALRSLPILSGARIGVVGWSQGGWLGAKVAAAVPVAFYVNIAGNGSPGNEQWRHSLDVAFGDAGLTAEQTKSANEYFDAFFGVPNGTTTWDAYQRALTVAKAQDWYPRLIRIAKPIEWNSKPEADSNGMVARRYRPADDYARVRVPTLGMFFGLDDSSTPESAEIFRSALFGGGNHNVTIHEYPNLNHGGFVVPRRTHSLRGIDHTDPALYRDLADWIARHSAGSGSGSYPH